MNHNLNIAERKIELLNYMSKFAATGGRQQELERFFFFNVRLGEFLLKKRKRLQHLKGDHFDQQSIADKIGVSSDTLRRYERGEGGMNASTLFRLLDALESSFKELGDSLMQEKENA